MSEEPQEAPDLKQAALKQTALKQTALHDRHVELGGRMVEFAGHSMPVLYETGPIEEHHITRRSVGIFDIDHMGQVAITGPDTVAFLDHIVTSNIADLDEGQSKYGLLLHDHGGVIDDVFVYRLDNHYMMVINADNRDKDIAHMRAHADNFDVELEDLSDDTYMLAVQGPNALRLLGKLTEHDLATVERFSAAHVELAGVPMVVGRTGYTGEDGVELYFGDEHAHDVWNTLLETGEEHDIETAPIGLAARDSLRFEPGFALYGHEISDEINPIEARLSWAIDFDKDFVGKESLLQIRGDGPQRKLITFVLTDKGVPREGYPVLNAGGETIGVVVTGMYAPTADAYAGNALVDADYAATDTPIQIEIRNKPKAAVVVKRPLYRPAYR